MNAEHISKLFESLQYEETKEVELFEVFTKMLQALHPRVDKSIVSQIRILETCTVLLEKQHKMHYPESLIKLVATYAIRQILQASKDLESL